MTRGAAVDGEHRAIATGGNRCEHLGDLQRQLTRRHEHHGQRTASVGFARQAGEHRHTEGQRLAGAGLGTAAHVATSERDRDRLGLDRERSGEAGGRETHVDLGRHPDVDERGRDVGVGIDRDGRGFGRSASWTWSGFATPTSRGPRWAGMFRHVEHGGYRRPGVRILACTLDRCGRCQRLHACSAVGIGNNSGHEGRTHRQRLPPTRRADLSAPRRDRRRADATGGVVGHHHLRRDGRAGQGAGRGTRRAWGSVSASGSPSSATTRPDC